MIINTKTALALCMTGLSLGGLNFLGDGPTPQTERGPDREIFESYVDGSGNEHEITLTNRGWNYVDLIVYRRFELIPVKDGGRWQVKILSRGKRIATTKHFAGEQPAVAEAKKIVDGM
jgi:hypothetical protein